MLKIDGNKVRLIINGRQLNDNQDITNIKLNEKSNITAFITPRIAFQQKYDPRAKANRLKTEENDKASNIFAEERGFDYFKEKGFSVKKRLLFRIKKLCGNDTYFILNSFYHQT